MYAISFSVYPFSGVLGWDFFATFHGNEDVSLKPWDDMPRTGGSEPNARKWKTGLFNEIYCKSLRKKVCFWQPNKYKNRPNPKPGRNWIFGRWKFCGMGYTTLFWSSNPPKPYFEENVSQPKYYQAKLKMMESSASFIDLPILFNSVSYYGCGL